eukprot:1146114-Pelagomonas_calceolata.AAC.3
MLDQSPTTQQTSTSEQKPLALISLPLLPYHPWRYQRYTPYRWHASMAKMANIKGCSPQSTLISSTARLTEPDIVECMTKNQPPPQSFASELMGASSPMKQAQWPLAPPNTPPTRTPPTPNPPAPAVLPQQAMPTRLPPHLPQKSLTSSCSWRWLSSWLRTQRRPCFSSSPTYHPSPTTVPPQPSSNSSTLTPEQRRHSKAPRRSP